MYVTTAIAVVAALAVAASVVAVRQRDRADAQTREARSNAALAADNAALAGQRATESEQARQDAEQARQQAESERGRADSVAEEAEAGRQRAEEVTAAADLQRLEAQAVDLVDVDPGLAALLAVEANRISGGAPSSADALQRVLSGTGGVESRIAGVYGESRLSRDGATLVAFGVRHIDVWDLLDADTAPPDGRSRGRRRADVVRRDA